MQGGLNMLIFVIGLVLATATLASAQTAKIQKEVEVEKKLEPAWQVAQKLDSLDQLIQEARKNNPDIRLAEAKLREAQAERERVRNEIPSKLGILKAELHAAEATEREANGRYLTAKKLFEKGAIAKEDYDGAMLARDKTKYEMESRRAQLELYQGKPGADGKPNSTDATLKNSPDVILAEAKVSRAEADLDSIRLTVTKDVATAIAEIQEARAGQKFAENQFKRMERLLASKAVSQEEFDSALLAVEKAKSKLAVAEARLPYLLGRMHSSSSNTAAIDRAVTWLTRLDGGTVISDEEFLRRAMLDLQGRTPTADEMKSFLKMDAKDRRQKWVDQLLKSNRYSAGRLDHWTHALHHNCAACHSDPLSRELADKWWGLYANIRPDTPLNEKLRKTLDTKIYLTDRTIVNPSYSYAAVMDQVRKNVLPGVNLIVRHKSKKAGISSELTEPTPAGAVLQFLEDELDVVFVLRDYGIVVVGADEKLPPGAVRVIDFWKHGKTPEPPAAPKKEAAPKTKAGVGERGLQTGSVSDGRISLGARRSLTLPARYDAL